MIGIDIIDLNDPLLKERGERSMSLITHKDDRVPDHPYMFWLLWTAKEAVFKSFREIHPFTPKQIQVLIKTEKNSFTFNSGNVSGKIILHEDYILAFCSPPNIPTTYVVVKQDTKEWSTQIREAIGRHLKNSKFLNTISSDSNNLPVLVPGNFPVSFSHHGCFGAFCYPSKID